MSFTFIKFIMAAFFCHLEAAAASRDNGVDLDLAGLSGGPSFHP